MVSTTGTLAMNARALPALVVVREYGTAVVAGHSDVGAPGRQGDPDLSGDASDD